MKDIVLSFQRMASAFECVLRGATGDVVVVVGRRAVSNSAGKEEVSIIFAREEKNMFGLFYEETTIIVRILQLLRE